MTPSNTAKTVKGVESGYLDYIGEDTMAFGSDTRKSKHGLNNMAIGEVRVFDTPTERDKDILRRSARDQNERTDRYHRTRSKGDTLTVTRLRSEETMSYGTYRNAYALRAGRPTHGSRHTG